MTDIQVSPVYGIVADVHLHAWSAFSHPHPDGTNNRLQLLIDELWIAAEKVLEEGGNTLIVAGDLFHVRGSVSPSVLNPAIDAFLGMHARGLTVVVIPGNHDLEGKNSARVGNACTALELAGITVIHSPRLIGNVLLLPWFENLDELRAQLKLFSTATTGISSSQIDVIMHAPINGVLDGLPSSGLTAEELAAYGFKTVFSGHYHNHKRFLDEKVISVGALAHHTWSDVDSRAGYLIVDRESVRHFKSSCPEFIDLNSEENISFSAGNYVRMKVNSTKLSEIEAARKALEEVGAKGVNIISVKAPTEERTGAIASVAAGASLPQSIKDWINAQSWDQVRKDQIHERAIKILHESEAK